MRTAASGLSNLNLSSTYYWTSNEVIDSGAGDVKAIAYWGIATSNPTSQAKTELNKVRAIRAF
jgi:hypothetical protein